MWSRLRGAVAGMAEQAGIEVPGLDTATSAVTDLAGTAGDAASGVLAEVGASDVVGSVTDLGGSVAPAELVTGAVGDVTTTAGGRLDALKGHVAP